MSSFWKRFLLETMYLENAFWENIPFCNDALLADHAWALAALAFIVGALSQSRPRPTGIGWTTCIGIPSSIYFDLYSEKNALFGEIC